MFIFFKVTLRIRFLLTKIGAVKNLNCLIGISSIIEKTRMLSNLQALTCL